MKEIPTTRGKSVMVDDDDYLELSNYKWCDNGCGYALRTYRAERRGKKIMVLMHRVIMKAPKEMMVDHIDGNPSNNQKSNLRLCTSAENQRNQRKQRCETTSRFKGVSRCRSVKEKKWQACIRINKKTIYLGSFLNEEDAAKAYDEAAEKYHGKFVRSIESR